MKKLIIVTLTFSLLFLFLFTIKNTSQNQTKQIGPNIINTVKNPLTYTTSKLYAHDLSQPGTKQVGPYKIIGSVKDPLLLELVNEEMQQLKPCTQQLTNKNVKAIILDGEQLDSRAIKQSPELKNSINQSIPIVISKPTEDEVYAIIGAKVSTSDALVIIPENNGEEFEVHLVHPHANRDKKSYFGSLVKKMEFTPLGPPELNGKKPITSEGRVQAIKEALNTSKKKKKCKHGKANIPCHKKWTVRDATPYYRGDQKHSIDIGYEYNLYYVVDPQPTRKYLTVKTIGSGVSAGNMNHDTKHHKGYYQKAVTVSISKSGAPLFLEASAPETDNVVGNAKTIATSTGITFYLYNYLVPSTTPSKPPILENALGIGYSMTKTESQTHTYKDFSISADSDGKWTYWLSSADGMKIRRKNTAKDLVRCTIFKCKIRDLPQLANGSLLMPHMENVYYTDGDAKGEVRMIGKTIQYLQDIRFKSHLFNDTIEVKNNTTSKSLDITIDLKQVGEVKGGSM